MASETDAVSTVTGTVIKMARLMLHALRQDSEGWVSWHEMVQVTLLC